MASNNLSGLAGLDATAPRLSSKDKYRDYVTHALAGFQLLEEGLKAYIDTYYKAVRKLVGGRLTFDYHRADIDKAALGKLVSIFSKTSSNMDLVRRIRKLTDHRDTAAHRAFAHLYGSSTSDAEFDRMSNEYVEIAGEVGTLLTELEAEHMKLVPLFEKRPA